MTIRNVASTRLSSQRIAGSDLATRHQHERSARLPHLVAPGPAGGLCLGPMDGKQQTFVLLDEWVPSPRRLSRADALVELAARYFRSHGPATLHDFAWWAGLTVADAKAGLEGAKPDLTSTLMNARELWLVADVAELSGSAPRDGSGVSTAHLLPEFDEYLLGYKDRGDVVSKEHAARIVRRWQWSLRADDGCPGTGHRYLEAKGNVLVSSRKRAVRRPG